MRRPPIPRPHDEGEDSHHGIDEHQVVGMAPAQEETQRGGRQRIAPLSPLVSQEHQDPDREHQPRRQGEVGEGHRGQESIGLHDVDVQRVGQAAGQVLAHDPHPPQPRADGDEQESHPAPAYVRQEEGAEKVRDEQESHANEHPQDVEDGDMRQPQPETLCGQPPEQVEEGRLVGLRSEGVADEEGSGKGAHPGKVLIRVGCAQRDAHKHPVGRRGEIAVDIG